MTHMIAVKKQNPQNWGEGHNGGNLAGHARQTAIEIPPPLCAKRRPRHASLSYQKALDIVKLFTKIIF